MDFDVAARKDIDVPSGMRPRSDQFRTGTVRSATELMSLLEASLMQLTSLVFCAGRSMPARKASIMMVIRSSITVNEFLVRVFFPVVRVVVSRWIPCQLCSNCLNSSKFPLVSAYSSSIPGGSEPVKRLP